MSRPARAADALPMIRTQGALLTDPAGHEVVLKGCNLGNYLMLESWMWGGTLQFHDGAQVYRTLRQRFGDQRAEQLVSDFRNSWITRRDFDLIKSFGFNVVRLPFDYRLLQEDRAPFAMRADAFRWLDHAVQMGQDAGVYVILDLHGTPGGQSNEDHTGEAGQDHLWTSAEDQQRTVDVWKAISDHFKDNATVAAYDLINEPYGNRREDCRPVLARLLPAITQAIRSNGDEHVVFFPGALNGGISFYGDPHQQGLTNVAFTEHYYPGLFGSKPAMETQARVLRQELPDKEAYLKQIDAPYYVGEFNVVLSSEDADRMMRAYYDRFAEYGWAATMWSYKLLSTKGGVEPDAWYAVTNAESLPTIDLENSPYEDIEHFFGGLATVALAPNEALRTALTTATPAPLHLANYPQLPTKAPAAPAAAEPAGYTSADIGTGLPGYTGVGSDGQVAVMAGGSDINGSADSFRFVSQPVTGESADVHATISSFLDSNQWAKAGVMARWGDQPDSAMAMVNVFPDGTVALIARSRNADGTSEQKVAAGATLPVELRLKVTDGQAVGYYRTNQGPWNMVGEMPVPSDPGFRTGLALCSHQDSVLTSIHATLGSAADQAVPASTINTDTAPLEHSLLKNGSFEDQGASVDQAANWSRWGDWMNRENSWTPTHSGKCEIGYHHWQISSPGSSGLWQDVEVKPGTRYTFSVFAQHDAADANSHDPNSLELRLEAVTPTGEVTLNSQNFDVTKLATGKDWGHLSVSGTASSAKMRVLVVISASDASPRGGAVKLDDASLTTAKDGK